MKNYFSKFIYASLIIVGFASCSKDDKETDCSSDIVASYNGQTSCQAHGQYTGIITVNSDGANKVKIIGGAYGNISATINCDNKTITIPEQTDADPYYPTIFSGTGSYTANSITLTLTYAQTGGDTWQCSGTYLR